MENIFDMSSWIAVEKSGRKSCTTCDYFTVKNLTDNKKTTVDIELVEKSQRIMFLGSVIHSFIVPDIVLLYIGFAQGNIKCQEERKRL